MSPYQTPEQSWCDFLEWLLGRDVCGTDGSGGPGDGNGGGGGPGNGNGNGPPVSYAPPTTVAPVVPPPTDPPVTVSPGVPGESPVATLPPATPAPAAPVPATPAPTPQASAAPATPGPERAPRSAAAATAAPVTTAAATVPPAPPTAAPVSVAGVTVVTGVKSSVEADVRVQPVPPEAPVPEPRKESRSIFRSVIDTTSGPIGRRLVALAGVLLAVLIGILAATIDDRTQLVRRIQERRHVDQH